MYDFKMLSPADFEDLARDLLQQHWGIRLEAFKAGRDKGIDLRYAAIPGQSIIVQCKHFAGSTVAKLLHKIKTTELTKVTRLAPKRYVLVTSLPLNPADKDKLKASLHPYIQTTDDIIGAEDINNLLGLHPEIEKQHFKLWLSSTTVLERVLYNAEQVQTDFDVERVRRKIPLYVQTSNYTDALKILDEHKFVIISGVPGIGKTTLADMLLFAYLESSYQPVVIKSDIKEEGKKLFKNATRQIFYFDDFLGDTFLGNRLFDFLGKKEDSAILDFMEIIAGAKHAKLIVTTREHILQHAFQVSEGFQRQKGGLADHRCILKMSNYTLLDRGRILYNHIYFSDLPQAYKLELLKNDFYISILTHRNYNPRLVEWLSRFTNVKALPSAGYQKEVERVLENPEELWRIAFEQQISEGSRSLLLALYSLGSSASLDTLEKAWKTLHQHRAKKYNWKTAAEDWRQALQDLEGGFLVFEKGSAAFVNPSVKDFLDNTIVRHTEHLDDLLSAACFFQQIVCIWSLAKSEKGKPLQKQFEQSSERLLSAVNHNLQTPHEQKVDLGNGHGIRKVDVRPEVRLRTMVSIANDTRSIPALEAIANFTQCVIAFWTKHTPDYRTAVDILSALDRAEWDLLVSLDLHNQIKARLLKELAGTEESHNMAVMVDYVEERDAKWTNEDQKVFVGCFESYLQNGFEEELAEANYNRDKELLQGLSDNLSAISKLCGVEVEAYQDQINECLDRTPSHDDNEERLTRHWEGAGQRTEERIQVAEVKRLFDGLLQN